MKNVQRIVTGMLFAATLVLTLTATGADAYARGKSGGDQGRPSPRGTTTPLSAPVVYLFEILGITWE